MGKIGRPPRIGGRVLHTVVLSLAMSDWLENFAEHAGKDKSGVVQSALLFYRLNSSATSILAERTVLCERLVMIDMQLKKLGKKITQDQFNELLETYRKLGGARDNIDKVMPQLYRMEFKSPAEISPAKIAIFEKVLHLKKEEDEIVEHLAESNLKEDDRVHEAEKK